MPILKFRSIPEQCNDVGQDRLEENDVVVAKQICQAKAEGKQYEKSPATDQHHQIKPFCFHRINAPWFDKIYSFIL